MHPWVFLSAFLATIACSTAVERCYFCKEDDKICLDPVDIVNLPSRICKQEDFNVPRQNNVIEGSPEVKAHGFEETIGNIYTNDVTRGALLNVTFECIKVNFVKGNEKGTYRSCAQKPRDVKSNCEFLKEELGGEYKFTFCDVCNDNNCNSATPITSQLAILFALMTVTYAIGQKLIS